MLQVLDKTWMTTVNENISGCFRLLQGAGNHATLRSVANIPRKQNVNFLGVLAGMPESFIEALRLG